MLVMVKCLNLSWNKSTNGSNGWVRMLIDCMEINPCATKERRIKKTHWEGEAYKQLCEYDDFCEKLWYKTGRLITAN